MSVIATIDEFAYVIRLTVQQAQAHELLLDLAEGLVIEELGQLDPWPASAKAVVLAASARAYFNPQGVEADRVGETNRKFPAAQMGVYLTDEEIDRLNDPAHAPMFSFPGFWPYPDPVERPAGTVSG